MRRCRRGGLLARAEPRRPPRPLARIASGGELSRVALAIKRVLAAADATPTLVFDEVDAGIGGRSADPVGGSLWRLARDHQVLCVTHLPQIAAHADVHLHIAKSVRDGRTLTEVARWTRTSAWTELAADARWRSGGAAAEQTPARTHVARPLGPPSRAADDRRNGASDGRRHGPSAPFVAAPDAYLDYLRVERGLAAATISAYDSDLRAFARGGRDRRMGPGPSRRAATSRRCAAAAAAAARQPPTQGRGDPRLLPLLLRRGAHRASTWPACWTCPPVARSCPTRWTWTTSRRLLAAPSAESPNGIRDRALLELLYASGLRVSEALGLDLQDLSTEGGFVRVIGKGDHERLVPVGTWPCALWSATSAASGRRWLAKATQPSRTTRGGPLFVSARGRASAAWRRGGPSAGRAGRGAHGPCDPAHVAA